MLGYIVTYVYVSENRKGEIKEELNTDAFKVESVDNIEVLLQYAKAYIIMLVECPTSGMGHLSNVVSLNQQD